MGQEDTPTVWQSYETTVLVTFLVKMLKMQAQASSTQTYETKPRKRALWWKEESNKYRLQSILSELFDIFSWEIKNKENIPELERNH